MAPKVVVAAVDETAACEAAVEWLANNVVGDGRLIVLWAAPAQQGPYNSGGRPTQYSEVQQRV